MRFLLALAFALLPALTPPPIPSRAAAPGRIAFVASRTADGNADIFSADIGGEAMLDLTNDPAPDRSPTWSPDGQRIAFASRRGANWDLYVMRADGSDLQRLTNDPAYDGEPVWSPDGTSIAFSSNRNGNLDIYVLDLASAALQQATNDPAADHQPAWSPDSQQLAFTSWRDGNQEIYVVARPGSADLSLPTALNLTNNPAPDYTQPGGQTVG